MDSLAKEISSSLRAANLVPGPASNIIPPNFQPTTALRVIFPSQNNGTGNGNGTGRAVQFGDLFRAGECKEAPSVSFDRGDEDTEDDGYLVMLVDPDAPTPDDPKFAFWRHWIVSYKGGEATTHTEYLGPGPKDDSKPHRYLFLLFRNPAHLSLTKEDVGGEEFVQRRSFTLEDFIRRYELRLVGLNWMRGVGDGWQGQHTD